MKCTYGRIPTFGATHIAQNAVVGSLATTVADTALLLDVMAGPDARDRTCLPPPTRSYVAALDSLDVAAHARRGRSISALRRSNRKWPRCAKRAARTLMAAIDAQRVDVTFELDDYIRTYAKIEGVDKFVDIDPDLWQNRLDELDPLIAPGWEKTRTVTLPKSAAVESERRKLVHQIAAYFEQFDLLLTPMVARPAFAAEGPMPTEVAGRSRSRRHGGDPRHAGEPCESAGDHACRPASRRTDCRWRFRSSVRAIAKICCLRSRAATKPRTRGRGTRRSPPDRMLTSLVTICCGRQSSDSW